MTPQAIQFALQLIGNIAIAEGVIPARELSYLGLWTNMLRAGQTSNDAMTILYERYAAEVASGVPVTLESVKATDAETARLYEKIRNS